MKLTGVTMEQIKTYIAHMQRANSYEDATNNHKTSNGGLQLTCVRISAHLSSQLHFDGMRRSDCPFRQLDARSAWRKFV